MRSELFNQRGESVFDLENTVMFLAREAGYDIGRVLLHRRHHYARLAYVRPEAIKAFARKYDPQVFHLDEAAAKRSVFGGLCASGWHTAATWMK